MEKWVIRRWVILPSMPCSVLCRGSVTQLVKLGLLTRVISPGNRGQEAVRICILISNPTLLLPALARFPHHAPDLMCPPLRGPTLRTMMKVPFSGSSSLNFKVTSSRDPACFVTHWTLYLTSKSASYNWPAPDFPSMSLAFFSKINLNFKLCRQYGFIAVKWENTDKPKTEFVVKMWLYSICPDLFCVDVYIWDNIHGPISMFINMFYSVVQNAIILIWFVLLAVFSFSCQLIIYWGSTLCWVLIVCTLPWSTESGRGRQTWKDQLWYTLIHCSRHLWKNFTGIQFAEW